MMGPATRQAHDEMIAAVRTWHRAKQAIGPTETSVLVAQALMRAACGRFAEADQNETDQRADRARQQEGRTDHEST